eukprot:12822335-Ditylum_brightwellii.AAC.1
MNKTTIGIARPPARPQHPMAHSSIAANHALSYLFRRGNKELFTCCQYQEAVQARKAYAMVGCPSTADFMAMV